MAETGKYNLHITCTESQKYNTLLIQLTYACCISMYLHLWYQWRYSPASLIPDLWDYNLSFKKYKIKITGIAPILPGVVYNVVEPVTSLYCHYRGGAPVQTNYVLLSASRNPRERVLFDQLMLIFHPSFSPISL